MGFVHKSFDPLAPKQSTKGQKVRLEAGEEDRSGRGKKEDNEERSSNADEEGGGG